MKKLISTFLKEEDGVTAVEYALLASAAAATVGGVATGFYSDLGSFFDGIMAEDDGSGSGSGSESGGQFD